MQLVFMHPAVFIGAWIVLGALFALQDWMNLRRWGYQISLPLELKAWGAEFLIWGVMSWLLWRLFQSFIRNATLGGILSRVLPLSVVTCAIKEMIYVALFPGLPLNRPHMGYWTRLQFHLSAQIVNDMVVFWCWFFLIRGLSYYQRFLDSENDAAQLEVELVNAQLSALRMQLNPHFLFNAMNSISSLMRIDVDAADEMLEQLSSLFRISLERGSVQLIPLREEIEFIEVYLSMQDRRYADRVKRGISVDPELHDALVPAMILQPIVENAYVHGLSKIEKDGDLSITACKVKNTMVLTVTNSGLGMSGDGEQSAGHRVGVSNIRRRLELHYGQAWSFQIVELDGTHVEVTIVIPIQFSDTAKEPVERLRVR